MNGISLFIQSVKSALKYQTMHLTMNYRRYAPAEDESGSVHIRQHPLTKGWVIEVEITIAKNFFEGYAGSDTPQGGLALIEEKLQAWAKEKGIEYTSTEQGLGE